MRYCLVSRELAPFFGAGIGTYAAAMARAVADAGHEVTIITGRHGGLEEAAGARELLGGVRVITVDPEGQADHARLPFHFQRHAAAVRRALLGLHAESPQDVIEFPDYYGEGCWALWGRRSLGELAGARIVCHLHMTTALCRSLNEERRTNLETLAMQAAERETIRLADALVSPSAALLERTRQDLAALGVTAPAGAAIPYPFDVAAARGDLGAGRDRATEVAGGKRKPAKSSKQPHAGDAPSATSAPPPEAPEQTDIVFFGRLERRKGPDLLARAALRLLVERPQLRVAFIGGDTQTGPGQSSMRAHLERLTREHAANFRIADRVERSELGAEVARAKIVCLPSRWDNFPNALLEAMSLGACCVAGRGGGVSEIIEDGRSGLLCDVEEEGKLAEALVRALDDDALRRRLGAGARERVAGLCDPQSIVTRRVEHVESVAPGEAGERTTVRGPSRTVTVAVEGDWLRRARAAAREGAAVVLLRPGDATEEMFVARCSEALGRSGAEVATACSTRSAPVGLDREALAAAEWSGPIVATRAALDRAGWGEVAPGQRARSDDAPEELSRWSLLCAVALGGGEMAIVPDPLVGRATPAPGRGRAWIEARYPALAVAPIVEGVEDEGEEHAGDRTGGLLARIRRKLRG